MKLVSIIVPIYNSEKYLEKCINSLINQTYQNIEVILIDDGSTDASAQICELFQKRDERVQYIRQENAGVSASRNKGIFVSKGEFIVFIDSDDYVVSNYIESLVTEIKDVDLSVCGYYEVNSMADVITSSIKSERCINTLSSEEYLEILFESDIGYQGYVWNKLFKKDIIDKYNLKFDTDIHYNEDRLFVFEYVKSCELITIYTIPLYMHLVNNESAMGIQTKTYNSKMISEITAFERMLSLVDNKLSSLYALILTNICNRLLWICESIRLRWNNQVPIADIKYVRKYVRKYFIKFYFNRLVPLKKKVKLTYHMLRKGIIWIR